MSGATTPTMPAVIEEPVAADSSVTLQNETSSIETNQKQQDVVAKPHGVLSVSTNVSSMPRPAYRAVLPPQIENRALPLTPAPGYSPSAYGGSPYSDTTTPGCPPHMFSPSTPGTTYSAATPTASSQRRRRKARAPAYLPLDAYPQQHSISPAFATGHRTPTANSYLPMSGTLPTHTPSLLSPTDSVLNSQATSPRTPAYQAAARRSSLAPANSRPADQTHSQVCSPFSATATPGFPFSPVPLSAVSVGRPAGYQQTQNAQSFTPEQRAAQEALEAAEARAGSIGGLLAAAASSLSIASPRATEATTANMTNDNSGAGSKGIFQTILSPASSWSTTSSGNGGWGITSAGPILPGGDNNSGSSSRRTSFGDISAPLIANNASSNYTVSTGNGGLLGGNSAVPRNEQGTGMMGFVSGVGKKLGNVESDVWRWARGKPRTVL